MTLFHILQCLLLKFYFACKLNLWNLNFAHKTMFYSNILTCKLFARLRKKEFSFNSRACRMATRLDNKRSNQWSPHLVGVRWTCDLSPRTRRTQWDTRMIRSMSPGSAPINLHHSQTINWLGIQIIDRFVCSFFFCSWSDNDAASSTNSRCNLQQSECPELFYCC